jgi:hypothetical protein
LWTDIITAKDFPSRLPVKSMFWQSDANQVALACVSGAEVLKEACTLPIPTSTLVSIPGLETQGNGAERSRFVEQCPEKPRKC